MKYPLCILLMAGGLLLAGARATNGNESVPIQAGEPGSAVGSPRLTMAVAFPEDADFILHEPEAAWTSVENLSVRIPWPADAPADAQAMLYLKDRDDYWYQTAPSAYLRPAETNTLTFDLRPDSTQWEARGHKSSWHFMCLKHPLVFGLRVFSRTDWSGEIAIAAVDAHPARHDDPPWIRHVRIDRQRLPVYSRLTLTCQLPDRYREPFLTNTVHLTAHITRPDGGTDVVDGFYTRDYYRVLQHTGERIIPQGRPYWEVRYTPRMEGRHSVTLQVRDAVGTADWGPAIVMAGPPETPGFIRVSREDPRFFQFDNGDPFFSIGYNIRSPYDTRVNPNFPWMHRWEEGSAAYFRHFEKMHHYGLNLAEIWTAAWSLGLEWTPRWRGYHGIGQYNMMHAWELDRVVEAAERAGIYLNVVIHNHGKFSTFSDQEWAHNPHNVANGGYLDSPKRYFDDPRAIQDFQNLMRYKIARWGHSPHIFTWELVNELDLTGERGQGIQRNHVRQEVVDWHRMAGQFIAAHDVNRHLVTTHYCGNYTHQNTNITALAEMDWQAVDAYHSSADPLHIVELMERTAAFNNPFRKPVLITEFGGSPHGSTIEHIAQTIHAAAWAAPATATAGVPMLWWWHLVEEEHYYPVYGGVSRFMQNVDRRDSSLKPYTPVIAHEESDANALAIVTLKSPSRALGWLYHTRDFPTIQPDSGPPTEGVALRFEDMRAGHYAAEFWDTHAGAPMHTEYAQSDMGVLHITVPPFVRDTAFKLEFVPRPDGTATNAVARHGSSSSSAHVSKSSRR